MIYAGLDLHKRFSFLTAMDAEGRVLGQRKLPTNGQVVEFLKEFDQPVAVAIEATPSWYWLYDQLQEEGLVFIYNQASPHDMVSALLVEEAGGRVTNMKGGPWYRVNSQAFMEVRNSMLAGNPYVQQLLLKLYNP